MNITPNDMYLVHGPLFSLLLCLFVQVLHLATLDHLLVCIEKIAKKRKEKSEDKQQ